jgi:hypothetical protein
MVDNIKIDLREIGWDSMDWIDLAPDRDKWRDLVIERITLTSTCSGTASLNKP